MTVQFDHVARDGCWKRVAYSLLDKQNQESTPSQAMAISKQATDFVDIDAVPLDRLFFYLHKPKSLLLLSQPFLLLACVLLFGFGSTQTSQMPTMSATGVTQPEGWRCLASPRPATRVCAMTLHC
jgi:hypothetical protein